MLVVTDELQSPPQHKNNNNTFNLEILSIDVLKIFKSKEPAESAFSYVTIKKISHIRTNIKPDPSNYVI